MKKYLSKSIFLFLITVLMVTLFSISPVLAQESVEITFWDENAGPQRTPHYKELIKRFEAENPEIKIKYVGIPWSSYQDKMNVALASGNTPDVTGVNSFYLSSYIARDAFVPLDSYLEDSHLNDEILANMIDANRKIAPDNKLYQLPNTGGNIAVIWYREDLFEKHNVSAEDWSWNNFFNTVKEISDKEEDIYGYSIRGGSGGSWQLEEFLFAYTGETSYYDEDGNCIIDDNPKFLEGLKKLVNLYQNGYTPKSDLNNGYKEMVANFDTGVAAMIQHNLGSYGEHSENLAEDKFKATTYPKAENGKIVAKGSVTNGYAIFKNSDYKNEAWKFIEFLCSEEAASYWNKKIGQLPLNKKALEHQWLKERQHINMASTTMQSDNYVNYNPPFYLPDYMSILNNEVQSAWQSVLVGQKDPAELLEIWAEEFEAAKVEYEQYH